MTKTYDDDDEAVGTTWAPGDSPSGESRANGRRNGRDAGGRFTAGNRAAMVHGRRSRDVLAMLGDQARIELAARREAVVEDLGGAEALSTIQADLVERYLVAAALLGWMEDRLLADGVVTSKGRKRALYGAYAAQLALVTKLATTLGVARRQRRVPSLEEVLNG